MRKKRLSLALFAALFFAAGTIPAMAVAVYSSMPQPLPPNAPSLGYEATSTAEFGQGVKLTGSTGATLVSAEILMSNWALESTYEAVGTTTGFNVPMTLNFYNVGASNTVGSLIASFNANQFIQWRPEASAGCGTAWKAGDGNCYNGIAQTINFQLGNLNVPNELIWGLVFNTQNYGPSPTGVPGPVNSLNVGTNNGPSVGSDLVADSAYWNTSYGPFYSDGGSGGVGTFRLDQNGWAGYDPAIQLNTAGEVPEPATWTLLGAGALVGLLLQWRKAAAL